MDVGRGPNHRGAQAVAISIAFTVIAGCFVGLRAIARFGLVRNCGIEDVFIIVALGLSIALAALIAAQEHSGMGRHFGTLLPGEFVHMLKPFWTSVIVYNVGLTFTKSSILLQYQRFFVETPRKLCWIILGIVGAYGVWTCLGSIFTCIPVAYFWNKNIGGGHCLDELAFWFSNASFNIATDVACIALPIPVLKSLRLPKKQKYSLIIVFGLGGFGCITSILRLHSLYIISKSKDITWDNVGAATWSSVELNVGIMCACLPTYRPILNRYFPRLLSTSHNTIEVPRSIVMHNTAGSPRDAEARFDFDFGQGTARNQRYRSGDTTLSGNNEGMAQAQYDQKRSWNTTLPIAKDEKDDYWGGPEQPSSTQAPPQVVFHDCLRSNPVNA